MSDSPFWNEEWMKNQQKYWEDWAEMSRQAMGLEKPAHSPIESALEHWWQGISPGTTDFNRDFMEKTMEQGKRFFRLAENYYRNAAQSEDWLEAANRTMEELRQIFAGGLENLFKNAESDGDDALHRMMAFWEMPIDNWQRMVSSLSLMPGDVLRNMPHSDGVGQIFSAPGLGYLREEEGQYKQLIKRTVDYQRALADYIGFFSNLGLLAVERLRRKVEGLAGEERQVDSARVLFDLWVDSSEEVYGEQVMTPEYAKIHGGLVNALMALKQQLSQMVDESLGGFNMPTRRELRTLQDRLQESRRELKALRSEITWMKEQMPELGKAATVKKQRVITKKSAQKRVSGGKSRFAHNNK
jgi:polyhydroxyalkanoate synthase subunit PhaE